MINTIISALPANKDLPPITTCGFYVSSYVWEGFDPNKNYIGAAIMAVKDGNEWYVDGRKKAFPIEARNGWYGEAHIRPGYIIMREADYLQERYRDADINPECNGDPAECPTFHSGKKMNFKLLAVPKMHYFSTLARFSLGQINRLLT